MTTPLQLALLVIWKTDSDEALAIRKAIVAAQPKPTPAQQVQHATV